MSPPPFFRPCRDTIKTSHNHKKNEDQATIIDNLDENAPDDLTPQLHTPRCVVPRLGAFRRGPLQDQLKTAVWGASLPTAEAPTHDPAIAGLPYRVLSINSSSSSSSSCVKFFCYPTLPLPPPRFHVFQAELFFCGMTIVLGMTIVSCRGWFAGSKGLRIAACYAFTENLALAAREQREPVHIIYHISKVINVIIKSGRRARKVVYSTPDLRPVRTAHDSGTGRERMIDDLLCV
jgi:hypothetical protein